MEAAADRRLLGGVGVPEALLSDPERFGGIRQGDLRCGTSILRGGRVEGHVDEGPHPGPDGLELIADVANAMRFSGPVLCGHARNLASRSDEDAARTAVAALPSTNPCLQGRRAGTPFRRGITRLRELAARGVDVMIGYDNVRDALCPIGRHDPLHSLGLAVLTGHLDRPFGRYLPTITSIARRAMGLSPLNVDGAGGPDLLICPEPGLSGRISGGAPPVPLINHLGVSDAR